MTPADTDRFLAEIRGAAEGGAQIYPQDVLRLLRIVEEHGREVLRLRGAAPPPPGERWVVYVSSYQVWVYDSFEEARDTIEDELGTRTQDGGTWEGDEEEMWVGRVEVVGRVVETSRSPGPAGGYGDLITYGLRPVASPSASTAVSSGGSSGGDPEARALRDLARAYELDSSPALTQRLLEIADAIDRRAHEPR